MADELSFYGWQRSAVFDLAPGALEDGRLAGSLPLTLRDRDNPANSASQAAAFVIAGPKDVTGIRKNAITRRYPAPATHNAETTKFAYVEFSAPDLPWRYTPQVTGNDSLRPWIVLVVGTESEITPGPGGSIVCSDAVAQAHPLAQSARWAHVQAHAGNSMARLLSPRALQPNTAYVAAIVPAFNDAGANRWSNSGFTAPAYDLWRFETGASGDFETLSKALKPGKAAPAMGRAPVDYPRLPAQPPLSIRGAIAPLFGADAPLAPAVGADVAALRQPLTDPRNRPIVSLPLYGSEWFANPDSTAWGGSLNGDPRHRGVAGLGIQAAIDLQEDIVTAATEQTGALGETAQRIRQLNCGLLAARSLWNRRLPSDPMQRFQLYGPSMRRMMSGGGPVIDQIAGEGRPLAAALFSSAARRVLRRGPARTELAAQGAALPGAILPAANICPLPPERMPRNLPHVDDLAKFLGLPSFEETLGASGKGTKRDRRESDEGGMILRKELETPYEMLPCTPVDLDKAEQILTGAIDPTVPNPIVVIRVLDTIEGLGPNPLQPPEVCLGLDFPVWTYLRDRAADWLLPGVGDLEKNAVAAFESNPAFVDAFLAGFNKQVISELRWRNIPLATGCTPMRMFWGPVSNGARHADIHGLAAWAQNSALGASSHAVGAAGGSDVILVFRSELFTRYPKTLIYLAPAALNGNQPDWNADPSLINRVLPTFQGRVSEDIVFFRFDVSPADALKHWVALEEPPSGITFRNDKPVGAGVNNGADFAITTIDQTTRILIAGPSLIPEP